MTDENQPDNLPYSPLVDKLLTLGRHDEITDVNYYGNGIRKAHIPELMRMVADESLHHAKWDDEGKESSKVWAPLHAWRALAQMQAVETAPHLIETLFWRVEDGDEWIMREMPVVFQLFGVKAIPPLIDFINPEGENGLMPRILAIDCLLMIADHHEKADIVVGELLYQQLQRYREHDPSVNAHLAATLVGLKPDAQSLIEEAVEAGYVDVDLLTGHMLDIFDIANNMAGEDFFEPTEADDLSGLLDPRLLPLRAMFPKNKRSDKAKKQKRKQAKQSGKKNRKR